jgi:hypothetical protein
MERTAWDKAVYHGPVIVDEWMEKEPVSIPENWLKDKLGGLVKEELMNAEDRKWTNSIVPPARPPFADKALKVVYDHVIAHLEATDTHVTFGPDEVYVVWSCFILQNWKCLISTTLPDGMYYEVTYDADEEAIYLDAYKKFMNVRIAQGTDGNIEGPEGTSIRRS